MEWGTAKRMIKKIEDERRGGLDKRMLSMEKKTVRSLLSPFSYARTEKTVVLSNISMNNLEFRALKTSILSAIER